MSYLIFTPLDPDPNKKLGVWIRIRIHMDIFGILDPDPHVKTYADPKHWLIIAKFVLCRSLKVKECIVGGKGGTQKQHQIDLQVGTKFRAFLFSNKKPELWIRIRKDPHSKIEK